MKKAILFLFAIFFCNSFLNADKYYYDYSIKKGGVASIEYYGTSKEINIEEEAKKEMLVWKYFEKTDCTICEKLTKLEKFLINSALDEYSIKNGEIYRILVKEDGNKKQLNIYIEIFNNNHWTWYGFYC